MVDMSEGRWHEAVRVEFSLTATTVVESAKDAMDILLGRWPVHNGTEYLATLSICLEVLDRMRPATDARVAFILAAEEAGVTVVAN